MQEKKTALEKWSELLNWHSESSEQLNHMRYQIDTQKPKPQDLEQFSQELDVIHSKVGNWKAAAPEIDHSSRQSGTIIKNMAGEPVTAEKLVHEIEVLVREMQHQVGSKKETLQEVGAHWENFQDLQQNLSEKLLQMQEKIQEIIVDIDSFDQLDGAVKNLCGLLEEQNLKQGQKDKLHEQGRHLMQEDPNNMSTIQNILASIDSNWEKVNAMLHENKTKYSDLKVLWQQYVDCKTKVHNALQESEKTINIVNEEIPNDLTQASIAQDKVRKALDTLKKSKPSLDGMDSKGQLLAKESKSFSGFNASGIKTEVGDAHQRWQHDHDVLTKKLQNLEAQVMIWKQIEEAKDELLGWLGDTSEALSNAAATPSEPDVGITQLNKYKDELPTYYNLKNSIGTKSSQLVKLNDGKSIPTLDSLNSLLDEEFQHVKEVSDKLETFACTFGEQEKSMKDETKKLTDNINKIREALIQCDDLSGENTKILERLRKCQSLKQDLGEVGNSISDLKKNINDVKSSYPAFGETGVVKELSNLQKRYEGVVAQADKIESTLLTFLKKYHSEKFNALQRIVSTFKEKVQWCLPEAGSDRYNLEAKTASLQDIEVGLTDCETKKKELDVSLELLQNVENSEKLKELKTEKGKLVGDLNALKDSYNEAKQSLEHNIGLWQQYELASENVSSWLRDTEGKVRAESVNQVNLTTINDKIKDLETFKHDVDAFEPQMENVSRVANEIMKVSPESRAGQFVGHLTTRYQAIVKFIINYIERLETMKKNQDKYRDAVGDVQKWLGTAEAKLKSFDALPAVGPKTILAYQSKLKDLKSFADSREEGQGLMNKAVEMGEALFSGITPENRESIRTELRNLRDASEGLIDKANAIHKRVEAIMMQRSSFDDSYSQINQWIAETKSKVGTQVELKPTLQEKKAVMHTFKAVAQDIISHKNIISQLKAKIEILSDSEASDKFAEIMSEYDQLSKDSENRIAVSEKYVADHEAFLQTMEKMRDWLSTCKAEASVVTDAAIEKEGADSKLAVIDNLLQQKDEGDRLIDTCGQQLQVVLEQTDIAGHLGLHNEFEEQKRAWESFLQLCLDVQAKLCQLCSKWTQFESVVDKLSTWIKQKETQVKDQSLRNSLEAKQSHLDKLKAIEDEIWSKSDEFTQAAEQSQTIEGETELAAKVSQLTTRYQGLKNTTKVKNIIIIIIK